MKKIRSRRLGRSLSVVSLVFLPWLPGVAWATTAADICAPSADPCQVTSRLTVTDLSVLDFGTRTLIVRQGGWLDVGGGQMTIRAGKLTIDGGGSLRGEPNGTIEVTIDGKGVNDGTALIKGEVLVDGGVTAFAGTFVLRATGSVELRGNSEIDASGKSAATDGGEVEITSGGNIVIDGKSLGPSIEANGGDESTGGSITLLADGSVRLLEKVTADGGALDGGEIDIEAKGGIEVANPLTADGSNGWGFGGVITLIADGDVSVTAKISAEGALGTVESGSGDGGEITVSAGGGLTVGGDILAEAGVDGDGGVIDIVSLRDVVISRVVSVNGRGSEAAGGDLSIDGNDVTITNQVSSSGGSGGGGYIDVFGSDDISIGALVAANGGGGGIDGSSDGGDISIGAGDDLSISANIKARGSGSDGWGGSIGLMAGGLSAGGSLRQISGIIKASGNDLGGGVGGSIEELGCVVEQSSAATLEAKGSGGRISLRSREAMTIGGSITADGATGSITLVYRTGSGAPVILPTASLIPFNPATGIIADSQLGACPVCGNGAIEAPEECDDGGVVGGDGCDENCRLECGNGRLDPGEQCDDGNRLNGDCCSASCSFEAAGSACPSDARPCTLDQCSATGTCLHINNDGAPCSDNLFCNGADTCLGGFCAQHVGDPCPGTQCNTCRETLDSCFDPVGTICADDGNECTLDQCNGGGVCAHPPRASGTACTDDGNPCTNDICDGTGACTHPANTAPCDDGLFCNGQDTCQGGVCTVHAGNPCAAGAECNRSCNEAQRNCFDSAGTTCADDGNLCTNDICDGSGACTHPANTAPCDDGDICTTGETCTGGACTGGVPVDCGDDNPCTDDACVTGTGCVHSANSAPCNDGMFCNGTDTCAGGACAIHSGDPCPGTQCGACRESAGSCADPAGTPCDDGNACTAVDQCDGAGACVGVGSTCGNGLLEGACGEECDDGGTAAGDGCDPQCVVEVCGNGKVQAGEECDDGNTAPGDGCSPACRQDVPVPRVPGGASSTKDCVMAWALDPVPPVVEGFPTEDVSCRENDPVCDFDSNRFQCTFHVWMCVNEAIAGKPCASPDSTESFFLKKPRPDRPKDSADQANVTALEGAMRDLGVDIVRGKTVVFDGPGVAAPDTCTRRLAIVVPIPPGAPMGRRLVKAVALAIDGGKLVKDSDKLKLTCLR